MNIVKLKNNFYAKTGYLDEWEEFDIVFYKNYKRKDLKFSLWVKKIGPFRNSDRMKEELEKYNNKKYINRLKIDFKRGLKQIKEIAKAETTKEQARRIEIKGFLEWAKEGKRKDFDVR